MGESLLAGSCDGRTFPDTHEYFPIALFGIHASEGQERSFHHKNLFGWLNAILLGEWGGGVFLLIGKTDSRTQDMHHSDDVEIIKSEFCFRPKADIELKGGGIFRS